MLLGFGIIIRMRVLNAQLKATQAELHKMARHDSLTGTANRYRLEEFLLQEWGQAVRMKRPMSVILFDIDSFKEYNDHYGHVAGDECLKKLAKVAQGLFRRAGELMVRYGGEEFLVIMVDTELKEAAQAAESLRIQIEQLHIPHALSPVNSHVTISLGVAAMVPDRDDAPEQLIHAADAALYQAKQSGRNRAVVAD
jgi:diguanylate cyclase (GGDEF)-like protein